MFSWIKKLDGTPDHPMVDVTAAKALLAELPKDEPLKALAEISNWLTSVKDTPNFRPERRTSIIMLLDETAQPIQAALLREYLAMPHLQDFHGMYLWQGVHDYMKALAEAYTLCVQECQPNDKQTQALRELLPVLYVRLLRTLAEQMKLELMRYIEVEAAVWSQLYALYAQAESRQMAEAMVHAYPGHVIHTSPQRELLRALVLFISSPATLAPNHIEVAFRIAARMVSFFDFRTEPAPDCPYFLDLATPAAPVHLDQQHIPLATPTLRYFGAQRAVPRLEDITQQNEQGLIP